MRCVKRAAAVRWAIVLRSSVALGGCVGGDARSVGDRPATLRLVPDTVFDLSFEVRTSVVWLDSTHLAIIDADSKQVVRVGLDGVMRRIGGPGSGPGEFRLPAEVFHSARGDLLVFDPLARQIHRFDSSFHSAASVAVHKFGNRIIGERGDSLVFMWQNFPQDSLGRSIGLLAPDGRPSGTEFRLGTIDPVFSEVAELEPGAKVPNPEAVHRSDGKVVLGESRDYRLWLLSMGGHVLGTGGRSGLPDQDEPGVSESDVAAELSRAKRITQDPEMLKQIEASIRQRLAGPRFKFRHMTVDGELRTWVLADRGPRDSTQVDLFDADLSYLGTLSLHGELWAIAVEGDRVAVLSGTPADSPWQLSIYSIREAVAP